MGEKKIQFIFFPLGFSLFFCVCWNKISTFKDFDPLIIPTETNLFLSLLFLLYSFDIVVLLFSFLLTLHLIGKIILSEILSLVKLWECLNTPLEERKNCI